MMDASLVQVPQGLHTGTRTDRCAQAGCAGQQAGMPKNKIGWCGAGGLLYTANSGVGSAGGKTPALPQQGLCSKGQVGELTTLHAGRVIGYEAKR